MERPVTSKSRGVCRYYKEPRGCFAGDKCKFLHGQPEETEIKFTPYDQAKTCRYYAQGFCKRGDKCWFKHTAPKASTSKAEEEDELCSICFDRPSTYGLLMGCTHVFCINCIKEWRHSAKKNNEGGILRVTKLCPMCRAPSKYITPSSLYYKHDDPKKEEVVNAYKESMGRIPCRYFQRTKGDSSKKPFCPFGKDCFYQHLNADGTPFVFTDGVDVCMRRHPNHPNHPTPPFASGFSLHPFNYRNPLEMIEVLMSDQFGSIAAELTGALGNLEDELDLSLAEPEPTFRRSMLLRHNPPRWPTQPHSPAHNHDHDDADMPGLEPINRPSSSQSILSDDSMPTLQDVSESEESEYNFSDSDDDDEARISFVRPTRPSRHRLDPVGAAIREEILDVLAFADGVAGSEAQRQEEVRGGDGNTRPPFVTDGRGRVIGTRGEEGGEAEAENQRSLLGRMFNAFF